MFQAPRHIYLTIGLTVVLLAFAVIQAHAQSLSVVYSNQFANLYQDSSETVGTGYSGFDICFNDAVGTTTGNVCGVVDAAAGFPYLPGDKFLDQLGVYFNLSTSTYSGSGQFCFSQQGGGGCSPSLLYTFTSGLLTSVNGTTLQPDWSLISPVAPFTLGTTTAAIAASSSLWSSIAVASSSISCNSGNLFSDALCSTVTYLLVPSPSTLGLFATLPETEQTHWPFSWLYEVQTTIDNATSSIGNLPAFSMNLTTAASTTFASTTMPNFMPSFTFFSATVVMTYLPTSDWDALQALLAAVLWLGFVADVFFTLRNRFHRV